MPTHSQLGQVEKDFTTERTESTEKLIKNSVRSVVSVVKIFLLFAQQQGFNFQVLNCELILVNCHSRI